MAGKHGRARSRVRCGIRKGKVDVPVPEIRISSVAGAGPGEGEKEKKVIKSREGGGKGKDTDGAILGMNANQSCVWRYRRHRGVLLSVERTDYTNVEMWKGLVNAGVTGVKVPTKWELFGDVDATIEIKRLNEIISTAKSYSLGVLLELLHPQPRGAPEGTPDMRSIVMKLYEEVLGRHENIVGVELSREGGAQRREVSFERNLQIWCEVLSGHDMPIYVPVHLGRLEDWVEWIKRMGSGIVLDVLMDSGVQGINRTLKGQGVDWVITARDQAVWEELKKEGVEAWEGFAGCWVAKGDTNFAGEEVEGIMLRKEVIIRAGRVKAELKSSAGREWSEGRGDDREQREAFEEGWEVGFSDAVGFWCNMWEGRAAVGLGLGLGSIHMENGSSVSGGDSGACVGRARIGCLAGWVGKRVRLWVEGKGEPEGVGNEVRERVTIGAGEFAEGVRRGVHIFETQVLKGDTSECVYTVTETGG